MTLDGAAADRGLTARERQRVEILRCLLQAPRLLIMDEPTSVLTPQEARTFFAALRKLASEGVAFLHISHKHEEIRALCDRATILRGGRVVACCDPRVETARSLAEMMIGGELAAPAVSPRGQGATLLEVEGSSLPPRTVRYGASGHFAVAARGRDPRHRRARGQRAGGASGRPRRRFASPDKDPVAALRIIFLDPLTDPHSRSELLVKGAPPVLIVPGFSFGFRAGVWIIGAKGAVRDGRGRLGGRWLWPITTCRARCCCP